MAARPTPATGSTCLGPPENKQRDPTCATCECNCGPKNHLCDETPMAQRRSN
ncbi:TPA: hypothetical protein N0F65_000875 [Lagenidium giganteum]|uniref:Uncharacterized protein n=1 Tax=Lagenidium giganteum TaxID=4803 RepID=A0AAV2YXA8_9STRA|nr:TPA: hypothetical protein N0F65_000875 [Lagenidium giganteum]